MLRGFKVLDLSNRLGWLAGRILGDLGADVVKVEQVGASLDAADWRAFNVNKRLLRLDLASHAGRDAIRRMIAHADVLLETALAGDPDTAWLQPELVASLNAELVHVSITPFGRHGPRADWRGTDLELMAAGGAMSMAGRPDGAPLRISVPQAGSWAGAHAATGALVALKHRAESGKGQHVDVSAQASIVVALAHAPAFFDLLGETPTRAGSHISGRSVKGANYRAFWRCKDGYINFVVYGGPAGRRTNKALTAWMHEKGIDRGPLADIDWDKFDPKLASQAEVDQIEAPLATFFASITKAEFLEGACQREMLGYPVSTVADIATDPQLDARKFWQDVSLPEGGSERHCGAFYVADGERPALRNRPPDSCDDSVAVLKDFGFSSGEIKALRSRHTVEAA